MGDIWFHDGNGVPSAIVVRMSDFKDAWSAEADAGGTSGFTTSWTNRQSAEIPAAGKYLVLSNYRIKIDSASNGFVKARVVLGSEEVGKVKMITERMLPTRKSFINYGGMMGWLVDAKSAGTIHVQYLSTIGGAYSMFNDGNG